MAQCHRSERKHVAGIPHFQHVEMGDPSKIILLEEVLRIVRHDRLVEAAGDTGRFLLQGLLELQVSSTRFTFRPIIRSGHQRTERLLGGKGTVGEGGVLFTVCSFAIFLGRKYNIVKIGSYLDEMCMYVDRKKQTNKKKHSYPVHFTGPLTMYTICRGYF